MVKKNILVTGSNGQLGTSLNKISVNYSYNFFFKEKKELDITNFQEIENFIVSNNINSIINCAAYTNVCSADKNRILSDLINNVAVENIAKICNKFSIQLIHISTDYVFDGKKKKPYKEDDQPNPINFYGLTKLIAEKCILKYNLINSAIIRTSWLYSNSHNNFVNKILEKIKNKAQFDVVKDEIGSPTNAIDLANIIMQIIPKLNNSKAEIYHFSNIGYCSRYDFACKINETINGKSKVLSTFSKNGRLKRPRFSALDPSKISKVFGITNVSWSISLEKHLKNYYFFENEI